MRNDKSSKRRGGKRVKTFTLVRDGRKHKVALTSLYPDRDAVGARDALNYYARCGVYAPDESGRLKWAHRSLEGVIPIPDLVRWAIRKGFVQWVDENGREVKP